MKENKPDLQRFDDRLSAAYSRTDNKEQQYDDWASTYDTDLIDDLGYVAYRDAGDIFIDVAPDRDARVVDVACGTGLAGQYLKQNGYTNIHGADLSTEMMAIAHKRQIYLSTWQHDFTKPAEPTELYDSLLCVGMFSYAVPEISDMHNVVNCVKPGSVCVITVNGAAWKDLGLESKVYQEAERSGFTIEQVLESGYIEKEGIDSRVLVIRRQ
jgi:trans-aconitate methyltransferase